MQVLVIQTAFLGDLLLGIPFFQEIKKVYPNAHITILCRKGLGGFLTAMGLVNEAIEIDKSSKANLRLTTKNAIAVLRQRQFEAIFCPHESLRSAQLVWTLRAKNKVGYSRWFKYFIFNHRIERPMNLPEALRQLALLEVINPDLWKKRLLEYLPEQGVPDWASMSISKLLDQRQSFKKNGDISVFSSTVVRELVEQLQGSQLQKDQSKTGCVFLAPGSVWRTKQWTIEGYVAVAKNLLGRGFKVVLFGAPEEVELCQKIVSEAPGAVSIAGKTRLWESAEIYALADAVVCNDSGAMHLAAAAGVPTVAVFGPTVLRFGYRPWQNAARVVEDNDLKCRPCGRHGNHVCPIGTHECMKRVSSQQVLNSLNEVLTTIQTHEH
jgi:heptosyltransferase-2